MSTPSVASAAWSTLHRTGRAPRGRRGPDAEADKARDRAVLRRVLHLTRGRRRRLALFVTGSTVLAALAVATPVLAGHVVDAVTARRAGLVTALAGLIALVALLEAALGVAVRWTSARLGEDLILDLRTAVFDHVQRQPVAFFTRTRTGALVSRLDNDVLGAQRAFSGTLSGIVSNAVAVLLTGGVMLTTSWQTTLLALVLLPLFLLPARRAARSLADLARESAQLNAAMVDRVTERSSAAGATLLKLHGDPAAESAAFAAAARRVRDIGVRRTLLQTLFVTALTLVTALALALVYGVGGLAAVAGRLDGGEVVTLALLLTRLYAPLTALANARVDLAGVLVSFERVFEVLDLVPLVREAPDAVDVPRTPGGGVAVRFEHVDFAYPAAADVSLASLEDVAVVDTRGGQQVLHDVDFTVEPGQLVALVGASGAGKSTTAALLARLHDTTGGTVRLGGVDVRRVRAASLRATVGVVTQDAHLLHESLRTNLLLARPGADDAELSDALRRARLGDVLAALPEGLDTVVGDRGHRFSGGERQRLAVARLLLARPPVVVLDEATAHLDSVSEAAVQAALDEALADRTALVIAHRLSTVRAADRILVMDAGRVVEQGTHEELLAAGGRYAVLHATQTAAPSRS